MVPLTVHKISFFPLPFTTRKNLLEMWVLEDLHATIDVKTVLGSVDQLELLGDLPMVHL